MSSITCFYIHDQRILVNTQIQRWLFTDGEVHLPIIERLSLTHTYDVALVANIDRLPVHYQWVPMRELIVTLDETHFLLVSRGVQLLAWSHSYIFCSRCSGKMQLHETECAKICVSCGYVGYPRINPCIMVLITKGDEVLLIRSKQKGIEHFSLVAGFIEAGESAEQAVYREVKEEVSIAIHKLRYRSSQSWPFPHSLMLGFVAEYHQGELIIDVNELNDAQWFKRQALPNALSRKGTLSRRLIDDWLAENT